MLSFYDLKPLNNIHLVNISNTLIILKIKKKKRGQGINSIPNPNFDLLPVHCIENFCDNW